MGQAERRNPRSVYNRKRGLSVPEVKYTPPEPEVISVGQKIKDFICQFKRKK
jgi:hypothetical protein